MHICETYFLIVERFAKIFGGPLPKRVLSIGSPDSGWGVDLNATGIDQAWPPGDPTYATNFDPYTAFITWGGFPAGIVTPGGGVIAAGSAANEDTFKAWLKTAEART